MFRRFWLAAVFWYNPNLLDVPAPVFEDYLLAITATSSFYPGWNFSNACLFFNDVLTLVAFPEPAAGMVLPGVPSVDSLFLDGRSICVLE